MPGLKKPKAKLFPLETKDWSSLMNWSGVKVSEVQNGKKSMLKIIDMTIFFWGICGLIEDYEVSLPKGKRERERERVMKST